MSRGRLVFPVNGWHIVRSREPKSPEDHVGGSLLAEHHGKPVLDEAPEEIPVVCHNLTLAGRPMCIYPATSTQFNDDDDVEYSSIRWRRLLVADLVTGLDLPLFAFTPADAYLIVERYAGAIEGARGLKPLNPIDRVAVSQWALDLYRAHHGHIRPVREWLVKPPPARTPDQH